MEHKTIIASSLSLLATTTGSIKTTFAAQDTSSTLGSAIGAANNGGQQINLKTSFGFQTLGQAINTIISIIFIVAGLLAFFYILLGAFNYLTAGDDSAKTGKARTMITNAVIGLILVALVYVIWVIAIHLVPGLSDFFTASSNAGTQTGGG